MRVIAILTFLIPSFLLVAQVPYDSLIAYYPFNGNAKDASGNGNNGQVFGAELTSDRFGTANSAYYFDGIDDYIEIQNSHTLSQPAHQVSISAWAQPTGLTFRYYIVDKRISANSFPFSSYVLFSTPLSIEKKWTFTTSPAPIVEGKTLVTKSTTEIDTTIWVHIVGVYDSLNMKIYINGNLEDSVPLTGAIDYSEMPLFIGTAALVHDNFMKGILDDIRIYNKALNQIEVSALYNENICIQEITVTDMLVINLHITSFKPVQYKNTIKIYPNPTSNHIIINCTTFSDLEGWVLNVFNNLGQSVYTNSINQEQEEVDLSNWGGKGIYFVHLINSSGEIEEIKKIVLQ